MAYHERVVGYAYDELPRLYSQDPNISDSFDRVKHEPGIPQYDISFAIGNEQSGTFASSYHMLPSTTDHYPQQYADAPREGFVKQEEDEYEDYLFQDDYPHDENQHVDATSERSWSGSPGAADSDNVEDPHFVTDAVYSSVGLPSHAETENYLRQTLGIPLQVPVTLYALADDPRGPNKPSVTTMARLAIWGSPHKKLTLNQIFEAVEQRYPSLGALVDKPHRRSIRHNLSLKGIFRREKRPQHAPGQGDYWFLDVRYGEANKRRRHKTERNIPEGTHGTILPYHPPEPSSTPSRQAPSNLFLHAPVPYRKNYSTPNLLMDPLSNRHHSQEMLESLRDSEIDPHTPPVRPSYGSTIPYSEYAQVPEQLPPYYTQDRFIAASQINDFITPRDTHI
ncbi:Forkhead box protein I1-ema [Psilocybe cubensis]|nr:Forkhead box protein I1-ema [Psilocybe cubensis]KAH9481885.1 Forkhead box protein I1-ema [Psilocybe cubensis]